MQRRELEKKWTFWAQEEKHITPPGWSDWGEDREGSSARTDSRKPRSSPQALEVRVVHCKAVSHIQGKSENQQGQQEQWEKAKQGKAGNHLPTFNKQKPTFTVMHAGVSASTKGR